MANRETSKTPARKTTAKAKPRTATATKARRSPKMEVATAKGTVTEPKVGDQAKLDAAVKAAAAWREAETKRDTAIRAAVKSGTSARQVAMAVGLTHGAVLKVVKR